jgi:hypothetical protein
MREESGMGLRRRFVLRERIGSKCQGLVYAERGFPSRRRPEKTLHVKAPGWVSR